MNGDDLFRFTESPKPTPHKADDAESPVRTMIALVLAIFAAFMLVAAVPVLAAIWRWGF